MESIATVGRQTPGAAGASTEVRIDYVNYRGERSVRRIVPKRLYFDEVEWHHGAQWMLDAWDMDKHALRSFALADICRWGV